MPRSSRYQKQKSKHLVSPVHLESAKLPIDPSSVLWDMEQEQAHEDYAQECPCCLDHQDEIRLWKFVQRVYGI